MVTCVVGIVGIIFISKPAFLFGDAIYDEYHFQGCLLVLIASVGFAVSCTMIKIIASVPAEVKM